MSGAFLILLTFPLCCTKWDCTSWPYVMFAIEIGFESDWYSECNLRFTSNCVIVLTTDYNQRNCAWPRVECEYHAIRMHRECSSWDYVKSALCMNNCIDDYRVLRGNDRYFDSYWVINDNSMTQSYRNDYTQTFTSEHSTILLRASKSRYFSIYLTLVASRSCLSLPFSVFSSIHLALSPSPSLFFALSLSLSIPLSVSVASTPINVAQPLSLHNFGSHLYRCMSIFYLFRPLKKETNLALKINLRVNQIRQKHSQLGGIEKKIPKIKTNSLLTAKSCFSSQRWSAVCHFFVCLHCKHSINCHSALTRRSNTRDSQSSTTGHLMIWNRYLPLDPFVRLLDLSFFVIFLLCSSIGYTVAFFLPFDAQTTATGQWLFTF